MYANTLRTGLKTSIISPLEKFITNPCTGSWSPKKGFPFTAKSKPVTIHPVSLSLKYREDWPSSMCMYITQTINPGWSA